MKPIQEVIQDHHLPVQQIDLYTAFIAKIREINPQGHRGGLVLMTGMTPNPSGEGKTTTVIGLVDALNHQGTKTIGVLREPSMGPVFGMKGTGSGANKARLEPFDKINLHFTGDFHALTTANNLIAAMIDNEIYHHSALQIDPERVLWQRCLDVNDRSLRDVVINGHHTSFNITAASDLMALFCLARSEADFFDRLNNTVIAYNILGEAVYLKDLHLQAALQAILKEAFLPNLVQTLEGSPFLLHGGPFANIAHGTSSIIAGNMAQQMADLMVTECGFGSELGLEKFCDIVCPEAGWTPNLVCLLISLKSIHAQSPENNSLEPGFANILGHLEHIRHYKLTAVCLINVHSEDDPAEMAALTAFLDHHHIPWAKAEAWAKGSAGMAEAAKLVLNHLNPHPTLVPLYHCAEPLMDKIIKIVQNAYGGAGVVFTSLAKTKLANLSREDYYICFAKTPYSFTDDPHQHGRPHGFQITVRDIEVNEAANFLILLSGTVYRIPGLPKIPAAKDFTLKTGADFEKSFKIEKI